MHLMKPAIAAAALLILAACEMPAHDDAMACEADAMMSDGEAMMEDGDTMTPHSG